MLLWLQNLMINLTRIPETATDHVSPNYRAFTQSYWKVQNKVLPITSEHPSSEYNPERKLQENLSLSNQIFEQPEEELIEFNG